MSRIIESENRRDREKKSQRIVEWSRVENSREEWGSRE